MDCWIWTLVCLLLGYLVLKAYTQVTYFSRQGIPSPPELPFIGSILALFVPRRHVNQFISYLYNSHPDAKYIGFHVFVGRAILIRDLDLVKTVLVKRFDHFADRKTFVDEATDPLFGQNLNFLNGDRWREVRNTLSPAFTASKMRAMYVLMEQCAQKFTDGLLEMYEGREEGVDMKDVVSRYTNDVIASCAFGIEVDSLRVPDNEFYMKAKGSASFSGTTMLKLMLEMMFPRLTRLFGLRIVNAELTDFFVNVISSTMKYRDEHNITRPDMLQLMMETRSDATAAKFDLLEMTAQAFIFFLAGFDASATQTCLIAHELAAHPEIQDRVQAEVDAIMKSTGGKPTYEAVQNSMPYLDAVFSEAIRLHPIAFLNRLCSQEFDLPPATPEGKPFKIPVGMGIFVPVAGLHSDPDLYPDPEKFDPERFADKKVNTADVTNLGFGLGPRMCIGNRFAILEVKALFVHLLARARIVPCARTRIPLLGAYDKNIFAPAAEGGFWLGLEKRTTSL